MYTTKFGDFNSQKGNVIMDEETTLRVLLSNEFGQNVPKEFQNITSDQWAQYAFKNNKEYIVTYYKDDKPYVTVTHTLLSIGLSYYIDKEGELFNFLNIWFNRGYLDYKSKDEPFVPYNKGKIFLGQITEKSDLVKKLIFYSEKKKNNVFLEEVIEENRKTVWVEQYGTADLSKNWFDAPKHYLDYEYLFDYQKLFENLPEKPKRD